MLIESTAVLLPVILLVEDNPDDVALVRAAFLRTHLDCNLQIASTGEQALLYLSGEGKYALRTLYPVPALVLLDLKLPGMDGFEVLSWIRRHPQLSRLHVVVLTSSGQIRDANQAYQLGANSFLVKPADFENFAEVSRAIYDHWLSPDKAAGGPNQRLADRPG